jgi:serine/threonine protein kinase
LQLNSWFGGRKLDELVTAVPQESLPGGPEDGTDVMNRANLKPGVQLGDFRIECRIGAGGMGEVYRARQLSLNRIVAVKVIDTEISQPREVARFRRAAQAAARLQHPNIAATFAVGEDNGVCYLVMEYVDGASFQQVIPRLAAAPLGVRLRVPAMGLFVEGVAHRDLVVKADLTPNSPTASNSGSYPDSDLHVLTLLELAIDGPPTPPTSSTNHETEDTPTTDMPGAIGLGPDLSLAGAMLVMLPSYHRQCCAWVRDAARGVQHAHDLGVTHRDLKPGNLMLDRDGRVRVIDFGLARCFDDATLTSTGQLLGSPLYMSPEQVTGRIELTGKTDIYSLGMVLYELLTLGPPITARNRQELFQRIISKPLEPLSRVNPSVDRAIEAVVHKATAKDPDDRYETVAAFADDLERVLAGKPVIAPTYEPSEGESEVLNARPTLIPLLAAQFYIGVFAWIAYGSFLMSLKDAPGRDRVPLPFLMFGWYGGALAYVIAGLLGAAAVWMSRGYRWGYWAGLGGQLILIGSTAAIVVTMNELRAFEGNRLLRIVLGGIGILAWLVWQLAQYRRRPVRSWFEFARRTRADNPAENWFRGRPLSLRQ